MRAMAESVASEANRQVHDLGAIDQVALSLPQRVSRAGQRCRCAAIQKNLALVTPASTHSTPTQGRGFCDRETAVAFANTPWSLRSQNHLASIVLKEAGRQLILQRLLRAQIPRT